MTQMNLVTRQKLTDFEKKLMVAGGGRGGMEEGMVKESEMDRYTLLYLKWITSKDLVYSTGKSAQCYVAAGMGREFRGEWIHV